VYRKENSFLGKGTKQVIPSLQFALVVSYPQIFLLSSIFSSSIYFLDHSKGSDVVEED
jgi:hypothetical protein